MKFSNGFFDKDKIKSSDWQYFINHDITLKFRIGDIVFLKNYPEIKLKIIDIDIKKIYCKYNNNNVISVYPQMILSYKDAGLLIYKKKYIVSLN